jgi:hypothetical protein
VIGVGDTGAEFPVIYPPAPPPLSPAPPLPPPATTTYSTEVKLGLVTVNVPDDKKVWIVLPPE